MRSRYAAFAVQDAPYLLRTWHPETRPPGVDFDPAMRWVRLEILDTTEGSAFHSTGTVTFRAHYTDDGRPDSPPREEPLRPARGCLGLHDTGLRRLSRAGGLPRWTAPGPGATDGAGASLRASGGRAHP